MHRKHSGSLHSGTWCYGSLRRKRESRNELLIMTNIRKGSGKGYHMAKTKLKKWCKEKAEGACNTSEGPSRNKC